MLFHIVIYDHVYINSIHCLQVPKIFKTFYVLILDKSI